MAAIETKYHDCKYESKLLVDRVHAFISFLGSFGFRSSGKVELSTGHDNVVLTFSNNPNLGLYIRIPLSNESSAYWGIAYKGADNKWKIYHSAGAYIYGDYDGGNNSTGSTGNSIGVLTINGITRYTFHYLDSKSSRRGANLTLVNLPLVDYFTSEKRSGIFSDYGNTISILYYEDATHSVHKLTRCSVGGTSYPTKYKAVASPIMLCSQNHFYGYIKSASSVYNIYGNPNFTDGQIKIGGHTFQYLVDKILAVRV